jgi:hypothetical protein
MHLFFFLLLPFHGLRRQGRFARIALLCTGLCMANIVLAETSGNNAISVEQRVKAVSLYKFLGYVDWPPAAFPQPGSPYVVGVMDADGIADELASISIGHNLYNRPVNVRKLQPGDSLDDVDVLFIGRIDKARQAQILKSVQSRPILTITETDGGLALGSMINFRLVDDRVRFEVSLDAVEKSNLKISSRMLSVALLVARGTLQ